MTILELIQQRRSVRAFLTKPVSIDIISEILNTARFAPSGCNTQPWKVAILGPLHKQQLAKEIIEARNHSIESHPDYQYYPRDWHEPYKSRRFSCGSALYGALGIMYHDKASREKIWDLNYHFFNAPIGLIFHIDCTLDTGSYIDMGIFLQNVMLAARHFGLETCAQASLADYPNQVRKVLALDSTQTIICGMALGYPDPDAKINQCRTNRIPIAQFANWYD